MEANPVASAVVFGVFGVVILATAAVFLFRSALVQGLYTRLARTGGPAPMRVPSIAAIRFMGVIELLLAATAISGSVFWLTRLG